jgi:hypothetical protein
LFCFLSISFKKHGIQTFKEFTTVPKLPGESEKRVAERQERRRQMKGDRGRATGRRAPIKMSLSSHPKLAARFAFQKGGGKWCGIDHG